MTRTVGVVIPAYRADPTELVEYVHELRTRVDPDVVRIELDSPRDGVVERLSDAPAIVRTSRSRRGKGAAITAGFEALETDVLAFADADGSTPAAELARVIEPVEDGDVDLAVGSRRHPDAVVRTNQTVARRHLGDGFAWLSGRVLDERLYDYQCGAKAISADGWEAVRRHLYESGFAWDIELVAIAGALDCAIEEVPIEWHDRPGSTVSPVRTAMQLTRALLTARHRAKRLGGNRLHTTVAGWFEEPASLVDRR